MPSVLPHHAWAWSAALLALAIFAIDTFSPFQTEAIAVVYVIVIHLAAGASRREYLVVTSISCVILTVGSYVIVHGAAEPGDAAHSLHRQPVGHWDHQRAGAAEPRRRNDAARAGQPARVDP